MNLESPENDDISSTPAIADDKGKKLQAYLDETSSKRFDTNLLVAILIATGTFAAAFTIPGGVNSNGIAALYERFPFQLFFISNTMAFFLAVYVVFGHFMEANVYRTFTPEPYNNEIQYSIGAMSIAFASGMFAVVPETTDNWFGIYVFTFCGLFCVGIYYKMRHANKKMAEEISWLESRVI